MAGAWAILRQKYPSASVSDVLAILRGTAVSVSGNGYSDMRRINVAKAVTAGPFVSQSFTIHNDGAAVLSVLSQQLETPAPGSTGRRRRPSTWRRGGASRSR